MVEKKDGMAVVTPIEHTRVSYSSFVNRLPGHETLTEDERVGFRGVDYMVSALRNVPQFETYLKRFHDLTLGDRSRLTDPENPKYTKDLLWRVHNPEELFSSITINTDDFIMRTGKAIQWGVELRKSAEPKEGDSEIDKKAKEQVISLVEDSPEYFSLELLAAAV